MTGTITNKAPDDRPPRQVEITDAIQNLVEALTAVRLLDPGVYVAMHNKVLAFPGVVKDYEAGTFRPAD